MRCKNVFIFGTVLLIGVLFLSGVFALSGTSDSYTEEGKAESGTSVTNATSASFSQRFFASFGVIGSYVSSTLSGRFGVLGSGAVTSLNINFTSPEDLQEFPRGGPSAFEDDLGIVPNALGLIAKVYDASTFAGSSGANCSFYESGTLIGSTLTNSSGECVYSYDKTAYDPAMKYFNVNFTSGTGNVNVANSYTNVSIAKYKINRVMSNLRSNGKYYDGDVSIFTMTIRKSNESVTDELYDPANITADAATSSGILRNHTYYPGGGIVRVSQGVYVVNTTVNYTLGALITWNATISDDGYTTYLASTVHGDEDICAADFGAWSAWSTCVSSSQTRSRTDSSGCSEVETQSCTEIPGGGGGGCTDGCSPSGSIQSSCLTPSILQTRTCGNFDSDSCLEWDSWSDSDCAAGEVCQNGECVSLVCTNDCSLGEIDRECVGESSVRTRSCGNFDVSDDCLEWGSWQTSDCATGEFCSGGVCSSCLESWECTEWSDCVEDTSGILTGNVIAFTGNAIGMEEQSNDKGFTMTGNVVSENENSEGFFSPFLMTGNSILDAFDFWSKNCLDVGEKRCNPNSENRYQVCENIRKNKVGWKSYRCDRGLVCGTDAECVCSDKNSCDFEGQTKCLTSQRMQTCERDKNGCLKWGSKERAPSRMVCENGGFVCSGKNSCEFVGESRCIGLNRIQNCELVGECNFWSGAEKCSKGEVCVDGVCEEAKAKDSKVCEIGEETCINNKPYACGEKKNYNVWLLKEKCSSGEVCIDATCAITHCQNGFEDYDEEGIDCGGNDCLGCVEEPIVLKNETELNQTIVNETVFNQSVANDTIITNETSISNATIFNETLSNESIINNTGMDMGENLITLTLGVKKAFKINKGDRVSVTFVERNENSASLILQRVSSPFSDEIEEIHFITVEEGDEEKIKVTIESTPVTKDISLGGTEIFVLSPEGDFIRTRVCEDLNGCGTENSKPFEVQPCDACVENWKCEWTVCLEGEVVSYPYDCVDLNGCGTYEDMPDFPIDCEFRPDEEECENTLWECTDWGDCNAEYDLHQVLEGQIASSGLRARDCFDSTGCAEDHTEKSPCSLNIPIRAEKATWCYEDYVEIYEVETNNLVSRVKEVEVLEFVDLKRVDVSFITSDFEGYCDYCFDGVKNFDEADLDCGGENCPACIVVKEFFDWLTWLILILWLVFVMLFIAYMREREKEVPKTSEKKKSMFDIKSMFRKSPHDVAVEKRTEMKIENFFKKLFRIPSRIKFGRKQKTQRASVEERKPVVREVVVEEVVVRERKKNLLEALKRKLRKWKKEGYAGTASLESKIRALEMELGMKEHSFVKRIVRRYKAFRERRAVAKIDRHVVNAQKRHRKILKRMERKRAKEAQKKRHEERKAVKKKIKVLKREVRKRKLVGLMRKLKLWRRQGYYGTEEIEAEIKRLKSSR